MVERRKMSTWQIIATLAISAVGTLVLLAFADTREALKNKVDKKEMEKLEEEIQYANDRLDFIIYMHIDDDGNIKTNGFNGKKK